MSMKLKDILTKKNMVILAVIALITVFFEMLVFNFSSVKSMNLTPVEIAKNVQTDDTQTFYSDVVELNTEVKNIEVRMNVDYVDVAYASVILTDEGDKYEYSTPEYAVENGLKNSGFTNIYPFGKVKTIQVKVRAEEGTTAYIESIRVNVNRSFDIKFLRMALLFLILFMTYLVWSQSVIHDIYFDTKKPWQKIVIVIAVITVMFIGKKLVDSNELLKVSPWPHHKQYQELARSLKAGTVELIEHEVDPKLLEVENPYDTISLMAEGVDYSMDYAFYNGKYYAYFGIVPEVLFYYPHLLRTGGDMQNSRVIMYMYMILVIGVFLTSYEWTKRYRNSVPFFYWLLITLSLSLLANFVYLASKPDIYNVPVISAASWTMLGIGLWLFGLNSEKRLFRIIGIATGSLAMAFVAGCRPQQLLISGIAVVIFLFEDGFKNRKLFTKKSVAETIAFIIPYALVAILVCWYNYARFGNILDFGATYSLTTNDMNHRGFNFDRLFRGLYSFFFQPANVRADFPFLFPSNVDGNYMGRYLSEFTYGGVLVSNGFVFSVILCIFSGFKKVDKKTKIIIVYLLVSTFIIGAFDVNGAGVLYRYTCDFAPALGLGAAFIWLTYLDKANNVMDYKMVSKLAFVFMILGFCYSFFTFVAGDSSISLINVNRPLYYWIEQCFRF